MTTTLQPGSPLDAMIAVHIFGIDGSPLKDGDTCPDCGCDMRYCGARSRCFNCNEWKYQKIKMYSEEIEAAWEIVEKLKPLRLQLRSASPSQGDYCAVFFDEFDQASCTYRNSEMVFGEFADTAPHAICLAALKAKGISIER